MTHPIFALTFCLTRVHNVKAFKWIVKTECVFGQTAKIYTCVINFKVNKTRTPDTACTFKVNILSALIIGVNGYCVIQVMGFCGRALLKTELWCCWDVMKWVRLPEEEKKQHLGLASMNTITAHESKKLLIPSITSQSGASLSSGVQKRVDSTSQNKPSRSW